MKKTILFLQLIVFSSMVGMEGFNLGVPATWGGGDVDRIARTLDQMTDKKRNQTIASWQEHHAVDHLQRIEKDDAATTHFFKLLSCNCYDNDGQESVQSLSTKLLCLLPGLGLGHVAGSFDCSFLYCSLAVGCMFCCRDCYKHQREYHKDLQKNVATLQGHLKTE